jgi:hypothetical protein
MVEEGITSLLLADATLSGLIGTRIYPVLVPSDPVYPLLTYQVVTSKREYTLSNAVTKQKCIQFDCWGSTYSDSKQVQQALENVLSGYNGTLSDGTKVLGTFLDAEHDDFQSDARDYRAISEYVIKYS